MKLGSKKRQLFILRISLISGIGWTIILSGLLAWNLTNEVNKTSEILTHQARSFFQLIVTTRAWNSIHGGVYVPITQKTQPNPYLDVPNRDLMTDKNLALTMINPAYMTRQIGEITSKNDIVGFRMTSDKPINPKNTPDPWEAAALKLFSRDIQEQSELINSSRSKKTFRYMAPLWVEQDCLKCHAKQGYKKGDIRGGISVAINADHMIKTQYSHIQNTVLTYIGIWIFGLLGIGIGMARIGKERSKREKTIIRLQDALSKIKTLRGMLPICASCKKIRDDKGYWNQIEGYIRDHSEAKFTHGICPDCEEKLYGNEKWYQDSHKKK